MVGDHHPHHPVIVIPPCIGLLDGLYAHRRSITFTLDGIGDAVFLRQNIHPIIPAGAGHFHLQKALAFQKVRAVVFKFLAIHHVHIQRQQASEPVPQEKYRTEQHGRYRYNYDHCNPICIHLLIYSICLSAAGSPAAVFRPWSPASVTRFPALVSSYSFLRPVLFPYVNASGKTGCASRQRTAAAPGSGRPAVSKAPDRLGKAWLTVLTEYPG